MVPYIEPAVSAKLTLQLKEEKVAGKITIDTTNETGLLSFQDRLGEDTAVPANLGPVPFTSDNPAVATVAADANNPLQCDVTPVSAGTCNIGVGTLVDTSGNPITEADGSAFPAVESQALEVDPGAAVGSRLTLA